MRDDVHGLAALRSQIVPAPKLLPMPSKAATRQRPSFAKELARAADNRSASGRAPRSRVSPLRQRVTLEPARAATQAPAKLASPQAPAKLASPQALRAYPRPAGDNGRGLHWIPTTKQATSTVDRFVAEAQRMGVKWVTFLNSDANIGDNDYLVRKLVGAGIEPVMRVYAPTLEPLQGDVEGMVRHYVALGVHYFQPFNEPNLSVENPDGRVSIDRYLDVWLPAAKAIVRGGGLPGFGSMAPGGDFDDQQFLAQALDRLKARGEVAALDRAWLSMHNYTWNHPIHDRGDGDGFFKFRAYNRIVHKALGRDLPIIGTEGGSFVGEQEDPKMAAVTSGMAVDWTQQAFRYMRDEREPWLFASSVWTVASLAGGGADARFEGQALFRADGGQSPIVGALRELG